MGRCRDPYQIPKAGFEIAPVAGLATLNVNASIGPVSGGEFIAESTLGGMAIYTIYQALLTGLRTEAMRSRGELDRTTQIHLIGQTVWSSIKEGAAVSALLGIVLLVFPWMTLPLSVIGLFGTGKASLDLFHAFWDGLSESQQAELLGLAHEAGINLRRLLDAPEGLIT